MGINKVAIHLLFPGCTVIDPTRIVVDNGFSFDIRVEGYKHSAKIEWEEVIQGHEVIDIAIEPSTKVAHITPVAIGASVIEITGKGFKRKIFVDVREKSAVKHRIIEV